MIGIDTNVLVRFIAQDDPKQSPVATAFINELNSETPGFVTLVSLVQLCQSASNTFHFFCLLRAVFALFEAVGIVASLQDVAMMGNPVQ